MLWGKIVMIFKRAVKVGEIIKSALRTDVIYS